MFTYDEYKIISAVPLTEIKEYLLGLGGEEKPGQVFEYAGLEIEIRPVIDNKLPDLGIPRNAINVRGDKTLSEKFLTAFRFRFMSAGG